jgi:outer membrane protein
MLVFFRACLAAVLVGILSVSTAVAAEKIAVVDTAVAIFGSATAQNKFKEAEQSADFLALKAKYESSTADLQAMMKEAESKRLTWSQEEAAEHQKKMGYAKADADLAIQKIKAEDQQLRQAVIQQLGPLAQVALQEIIKEESITLLLRAESVLHVAPELQITAKLADRIDQKAAKNNLSLWVAQCHDFHSLSEK